jgi:stage II sporulation protein D
MRAPIRPPAVIATREVPNIRVRLGEETPSLKVAVDGPYRLTSARGEVATGDSLDWTEIAFNKGSVSFGQVTEPGPLEIHATCDGGIFVSQTVGGTVRERNYRGSIQIIPTGAGTLRIVNTLPAEHYLAGVLANEMIKSWPVEAYKAQCVAARTFALIERNARLRYDFDVYDSTASQVYGGCGTENQTAWDAVAGTFGIVATYRGAGGKPQLLKTYYCSTCGGMTASAGSVFGGETPPPLAGGVKCDYCRRSPKYRWPDVTLTKKEIGEAMRQSGYTDLVRLGPIARVEVASTAGPGGRAEAIRVIDTAGAAVLIRAGYWRSLVGHTKIFSTWFTLVDKGDRILVTDGRGFGHGVGLCQWGAAYLAERGKTGEEIVRYYYPSAELTRAY